jgi:hypothetical protein
MILSEKSYKLLNQLAEPLKEKLWNNTITDTEWQVIKLINTLDAALCVIGGDDDINKCLALMDEEINQLFKRREYE